MPRGPSVPWGIAHYWRVEMDPLHVYAYSIGLDGTCQLVADSSNLLKLDQPFDICLPIPPLGDWRPGWADHRNTGGAGR